MYCYYYYCVCMERVLRPLTLRCPCRSDWRLLGSLLDPEFLFRKIRTMDLRTWIHCQQWQCYFQAQADAFTIVGGIQGLERAASEPEPCNTVSLAVQHLQARKQRGVQLAQTIVPHVQLGHVTQEVRLVRHYAGDPVQSERNEEKQRKALLPTNFFFFTTNSKCISQPTGNI